VSSRNRSQRPKRKSSQHGPHLVSVRDKKNASAEEGRLPAFLSSSVLESLDVGIAQAKRSGELLYANPRFLESLGQPRRPVIGSRLHDFIESPSWQSLDDALARGARRVTRGELKLQQTDSDAERTVLLTFTPPSDANDDAVWIIATEVTKLVETSKALEQSEASRQTLSTRLLQVQDEERRKMARDLHDITGQDLAVALLYLDRLAKSLAADADARKTAEEATAIVRKVENGIRTLSYVLHPPLLDEMGLASALHWFVDGYSKRTGISVDIQVPESLSGVEATVADSGKGFDTAKTISEGKSGVGLQSMKARVDLVRGNFEIRSGPRGTRITVTVPFAPGEVAIQDMEARPEAREQQAASPTPAAKRVLVADDHEISRRGIRALFDDQPDFEICGEAADGLEAVRKAAELKPDIVIMDLSMPKIRGFAAAAEIRNMGSPTKILIYTSHDYADIERTARVAGCDGLVRKSEASLDLVRAARWVLQGNKFWGEKEKSALALIE